ncbi:MAG: hypothetical protein K9H84_01765 [Bacteroidales bacterium]|nr:hypothetical protein [Bacteroidales bacterium]
MKKLAVLSITALILAFWSCGDSVDETKKQLNQVKKETEKMAEDAKDSEKAEETEKEKETFSEETVNLLGLSVTKRMITDKEWENAKRLSEHYGNLSGEELKNMSVEDLNNMILDAGFTDLDSAKATLKKISGGRDDLLSIVMRVGRMESRKVLDGEDSFKKQMKEYGAKINEKGYSPEDLRMLEANAGATVEATKILYRLDN